ncbi:MAG: twin-arginine translocation pathway signal protein [Deltaproteobacteria bacterium]|nr:twin-arginine translocation pathway signal protein [Deltaproteobacteria bacterium]
MTTYLRSLTAALALAFTAMVTFSPTPATAASKLQIDSDVDVAMQQLYESTPLARMLAKEAKAILLFPKVLKMGFIVGVQGGNGALREQGMTVGYYNTVSASYGLQAGIQEFGYALFFMSDSALRYLKNSGGWEIGVGPSVVIVDAGVAKSLTTTTARKEIYAFIFSQKGLMAGLGLQGTKVTRIDPD